MAPTSVFSRFRNHRRAGSSPIVSQSSTFQSSQPGHPPPVSPARSESATTSTSSQYGRLDTSSPQPPSIAASSPVSAQPPVLPPIQRVASVLESRGSTKRPPRAARSTTSPVLPSPKRWTFEDVPEGTEEEETGLGLGLSGAGMRGLSLDTTPTPGVIPGSATDSRGASSAQAPSAPAEERLPEQGPAEAPIATGGFTVDFDDGFKLNSLDLGRSLEDSPVSPTEPAPPIQPAKRSRSPQKHWALPPLTISAGKDSSSSKRPISDGAESSSSSLASTVNRSHSSVTLNPEFNAQALVQLSPVTTLKPVRQRKSILNPMSLLHRRRTSQGMDDDDLLTLGGTVIRGKGVHDFDKPRTRRNLSTNDLEGFQGHSRGDVSPVEEYKRRADMPWTIPENDAAKVVEQARKQSTPVFKENFDEEEEDAETAVRRETLANPGFLARAQEHIESHSPSPPPSVEQPQRQEYIVPQLSVEERQDETRLPSINIIQGTPNLTEAPITFPEYPLAEHAPSQLPTDPAQALLQDQAVEQEQPQPAQLNQPEWALSTPTPRLKSPSNASEISRWSFVPGDSSAQEEAVLEQRHMEKVAQEQAERTGNTPAEERQEEDEDEEVSDYGTEGSFYEDDEESVPEFGGDDEEDEDYVRRDINMPSSTKLPAEAFPAPPGQDHGLAATLLHASQPGAAMPENAHISTPTLQSHVSPIPAWHSPSVPFPTQSPRLDQSQQHGLGLTIPPEAGQQFPAGYSNDQIHQPSPDNDDMYFNDGDIEEPSPIEEGTFDESVFDEDIKLGQPLNNQYLNLPDSAVSEDGDVTPVRKSVRIQEEPEDQPMSSSSLHAYHSALASAAAKAEASGKFEHDAMSPLTRHEAGESDEENGLPQHQYYQQSYQLPHQQAQMFYQQQYQEDQPYWQANDYDDFDPSDLALDSEDIAAANAEALAADDSGFYGREFNFYSRGANDSEEYSGGFFGTPGKDSGIQRQKSLREPILTPITERSEFSRAPSFMSMGSPLFGPSSFTNGYVAQGSSPGLPSIPFRSADGQLLHPSSPAMPSPGLKELASRMGMNHDDMTLTQLRKLRQQALGGAGFSPVTGHFSPSSPGNAGTHHFGPMLSPNTAAFPSHAPLPSSPLVNRSANIPSQSSSPPSSAQSVKIGEVPERAKRRSMMAATTSDIPSSPPSVETGRNAPPAFEDPRDYFSPDSPSSPFTASITGLGLDMSAFQSPRMPAAISEHGDEDELIHDEGNDADHEVDDEDDVAVDSANYDSDDLLDPDHITSIDIAPPPRTPHAEPTPPSASLHSNPISAEDLLPLPLPKHILPTASSSVYSDSGAASARNSEDAEAEPETPPATVRKISDTAAAYLNAEASRRTPPSAFVTRYGKRPVGGVATFRD